jgi:Zn-finger nucleic acid-binding protein
LAERVEGIDIDRCVHCDGVWLDPGEYDAVRHRIEHGHRRVDPEDESSTGKTFGVGDGVEVVLALLDLLI